MKRMTILILILIFFNGLRVFAPREKVLYIEKAEPIYIYNVENPLLRAVMRLESNFDPLIVNPVSGAGGLLQIMQPMIDEVNRICKLWHDLFPDDIPLEKFVLSDGFDPIKSIRIWSIVQNYHNLEYDINLACQIWFGRGVQHDNWTWVEYSNKIRRYL